MRDTRDAPPRALTSGRATTSSTATTLGWSVPRWESPFFFPRVTVST